MCADSALYNIAKNGYAGKPLLPAAIEAKPLERWNDMMDVVDRHGCTNFVVLQRAHATRRINYSAGTRHAPPGEGLHDVGETDSEVHRSSRQEALLRRMDIKRVFENQQSQAGEKLSLLGSRYCSAKITSFVHMHI